MITRHCRMLAVCIEDKTNTSTKGKTQNFQVISMRNALSDGEFAAQNAARREARAAG